MTAQRLTLDRGCAGLTGLVRVYVSLSAASQYWCRRKLHIAQMMLLIVLLSALKREIKWKPPRRWQETWADELRLPRLALILDRSFWAVNYSGFIHLCISLLQRFDKTFALWSNICRGSDVRQLVVWQPGELGCAEQWTLFLSTLSLFSAWIETLRCLTCPCFCGLTQITLPLPEPIRTGAPSSSFAGTGLDRYLSPLPSSRLSFGLDLSLVIVRLIIKC